MLLSHRFRSANRSPLGTWLSLLVSVACYLKLGYFTERQDFGELMMVLAILAGMYLYLAQQMLSVRHMIGMGMGLRLVLLFSLPVLSDDYFRFLWDGRLLLSGISPYAHLPEMLVNGFSEPPPGITPALYEKLNSPAYYSIYPPFAQLYFGWGAFFSPEGGLLSGVVAMRIAVLSAEWGTLVIMYSLLKRWQIQTENMAWYAFNPLIIIEFCGNLHLEVFMIFFLVASLWLLQRNRWVWGSLAYALGIVSKLLPLMFLPMLLFVMGWKKAIRFYVVVGIFVAISFLPLLTPAIVEQIGSSVDLYFRRFEFNASIYYIVRWVGFQTKGWNIIQTAGPRLSLMAGLFALLMAAIPRYDWKSLPAKMLFALSMYLFLSTIVHPWYIGTLVGLSVFTPFRFPVVWSLLAPLSYAAYQTGDYRENLWLVAVEYVVVYGWLLYELSRYYAPIQFIKHHLKKYPFQLK